VDCTTGGGCVALGTSLRAGGVGAGDLLATTGAGAVLGSTAGAAGIAAGVAAATGAA